MTGTNHGNLRGTTFVELMGAITIISLATLVMLQQLTISYREGTVQQERLWAYDKSTQILTELQSAIERGTIPDAEALHALADVTYNPVLTTVAGDDGDALPPDHPMSGNWQRFGRWVWARQLEVTSPAGQDRIRYVSLKLARYGDNGVPIVMSSMSNVVTLPRRTYPSTTVYDVYVLALAEVPSPLGTLPALRSSLESTLRAASSEAPAVQFRVHWITRLGYGRDLLYTPYFNSDVAATAVPTPKIYWYPERVGDSSRVFFSEYVSARHRTNVLVHDYDSTTCPSPHALADQFNHCMRLPAAKALFQSRLAAGLESPDEPPLQILLADITENPERYRNAILLNLHGDGIPFPPVRNYSDAASVPETHPGVRVVTHPANLCTPRDPNGDGSHADTEDVELRVYAWKQDPSTGDDLMAEPITMQILGGDFRSHLSVRRLPGGLDTTTGASSSSVGYGSFDGTSGEPPTSDPGNFSMWCETGYSATPAPYTWIRLHHTPLECVEASGEGLPAGDRLYGMEYVPAPLGSTPFSRDLSQGSSMPKNTARWRIRVNKSALGTIVANADQMLTIHTRIGTDLSTGTAWPTANQPRNLSTTYAWWARTASAVPPVERYQILGDPRHNPYGDVASNAGYNTCFAGSGIPLATSDWNCIDAARLREAGFGSGVTCDVPRALSVWRAALQGAGMILVNLAPLANRIYVGGEIAAPSADGGLTPGKIAFPGALFGQIDDVLVDSVSCGPSLPAAPPAEPMATLVGEQVVVGPSGFWVKPWLGELFADADYPEWFTKGNLDAGASYRREVRAESALSHLPAGAVFLGVSTGATMGAIGGTSFAQIGTAAQTFAHHDAVGATATLTRDGRIVPKLFGVDVSAPAAASLPFALNLPGDATAPHFTHPADFPRQTELWIETHAASSQSGHVAGGLLQVADPAGASMFLELVSTSPATAADTEVLLDVVVSESVRALQAAGNPALAGRVEQIGRVEILDPPKGGLAQNPSAIAVTWRVDFMGFDGQLPTAAYPTPFTEDEGKLRYSVIYSRDGGTTWFYAQNNAPAEPGVRPAPGLLIPDAGAGNETLSVLTPSSTFPAGELLLRVEAFHATRQCHYGHHTVLVLVTR